MPVVVACACGSEYELRDEFSGKLVKCPKCGSVRRAGEGPVTATPARASNAPFVDDPTLDHDIYLLRQKAIAIDEKYNVSDQDGHALFYVERPAHLLQNLFALFVALGCAFVTITMGDLLALSHKSEPLGRFGPLIAFVASIPIFLFIYPAFSKKRHITFYRDVEKSSRMFDIRQDSKFQYVVQTYTMRNARGLVLARFKKNHLYSILRKRWVVEGPGGKLILTANEDSIILSLARRYLGPLFGFLRTNFIFVSPNGSVIGEFKRKFTILDRYVLDLQADRDRRLDRRIALAMGVLLDTGERR